MATTTEISQILENFDNDRLLNLELESIRIPSSTMEEGPYADYLANYMSDIGLDVSMMDVENPWIPGEFSRQPIGLLKGEGNGRSLMLNGHMDPGIEMSGWSVDPFEGHFEDGWIWGMGAHDDKGGITAMVAGVEAIIRSDLRPAGDVLVCPVVGHKYGGAGTRALLANGVRADMCINLEHSNNTIANVCVGLILIKIKTTSPDLFFRFNESARRAYWNPIEQQAEIVRRLGGSLSAPVENSWLTFAPHADLPGFPMINIDTIHKNHYFHPTLGDLSTRECEMCFQIRLVPGQSVASVREDITRLLEGIKSDFPAFQYELTLPKGGDNDNFCQLAMEVKSTDPLVQELAQGYLEATGRQAEIGGNGRLGNIGDGNILAEAGIPSVQFGPGDIRIYKEWPTPDERVLLTDLIDAGRAIACATWRLTGHPVN